MIKTIDELLDQVTEQYGAAQAYAWLEDGEIITRSYANLRYDTKKMAHMIHEAVGERKKVALIGDLSYSWMCTYYGVVNSANIAVPMDVKLQPEELAGRLDYADVSIIFLSEKYKHFETTIRSSCSQVELILCLEDYPKTVSDLVWDDILPIVDPDEVASLLFTSGTTGDGYKAAMLTQTGMLADVKGYIPLLLPGDRYLAVLPIHHCFELFVGQMKAIYSGCTVCVNDHISNLIDNLSVFKITSIIAVPAVANLLCAIVENGLKTKSVEKVKQMLGGHLKRLTIGGAPTNQKTIEILSKVGIKICDGYGLTESTGGCLCNQEPEVHPESAGKPYALDMDIKIEDGEICLKGPMIMKGYYKAPLLTAKVMDGEWFHTGDMGEIKEDGHVIVYGRKDNLIKLSNGEKVYPEEWEDVLAKIEGVTAVMVCAIGDHLAALLYLKFDSKEAREKINAQIAGINEQKPGYEKIMDVRFRETPFPMTSSMKIKRKEVMLELSGEKKECTYVPPQNKVQEKIMEQVKNILTGESHIGIHDNLFENGLDSLTVLNLALFLGCDPAVIYECKTVHKLSECIRIDMMEHVDIADQQIKTPGINEAIEVDEKPMKKDATVMITGATGYLGPHIVKELLKAGHKVICLIRSKERYLAAFKYYGVEPRDAIECVIGDVTKKQFGLSQIAYEDLSKRVGMVFHVAASVNHVGNVEKSYKINVIGTEEVIQFCEAAGAQLYHMSSYAVCGFGTDKVLDEKVLDIGQQITLNPYIQTKYQAEERVLAAREKGVDSTIFRIGNLTRRACDGLFQMNADTNGMAAQIRALKKLGVRPKSMNRMRYDNTPVDKAAEAIVTLAEKRGTGHIWHIMSPNVKTIDEVADTKEIKDDEFLKVITKNSKDRDIAMLSIYYRMNKEGFNMNFDFSKTLAALKKSCFSWGI